MENKSQNVGVRLVKFLSSHPIVRHAKQLGVVAHSLNSSTWEAESGGSLISGQPIEFKDRQGYPSHLIPNCNNARKFAFQFLEKFIT